MERDSHRALRVLGALPPIASEPASYPVIG
jgi:hypothetical protein